jgi:hypothetical protein
MQRLLFCLAVVAAALAAGPVLAQEGGGYTFQRVVLWSEPGESFPRLERDPETGRLSVLFLGPIPETGWDPVEARRLVMHGPAFVPAKPVQVSRPRDPDPDWASTTTRASFDLNRDGVAEIVRARTVLIPDNRDPSIDHQRVLVELLEGDRRFFGDLLEGPGGDPVTVRSISTADITDDGYPDMMVRLESKGRGGIAFYSQAQLRYEKAATRVIRGFSSTAFRADRYGIFDLSRTPRDFFSHLPQGARAENPRCVADPSGSTGTDGHRRCRFLFSSPYLGWIQEFLVDFIPNLRILAFDLSFPSRDSERRPMEALEILVPVLGGGYRTETQEEGGGAWRYWIWKGKDSTATLSVREGGGTDRAVSLRLERN